MDTRFIEQKYFVLNSNTEKSLKNTSYEPVIYIQSYRINKIGIQFIGRHNTISYFLILMRYNE